MTQVHPESDGKQECDKRAFCAQHSVRATESFTEGSKEGSNEEPTDPPLHEMKRRVSNVPTLTLEQREKYRRFYKGGLFVGDSWVIDSEHTAVVVLDTSMVFLLTYTALVTPFEVAFLGTTFGALFVINRLVDFVFIVDILKNFFTAFKGGELDGRDVIIKDLRRIQIKYLSMWFWIDLMSVLPFDLIGMVVDNEALQNLRLLRMVRLLRLFKLLRVMRASRIITKWEIHYDFNYGLFSIVTFFTMVLLIIHWMACSWWMTIQLYELFDDAEDAYKQSWVSEYGIYRAAVFTQYCSAFYWATMTVTTIGYGDIQPRNDLERVVVIVCMLIGATVYSYIIGVVTGHIRQLDQDTNDYREQMDALNTMMRVKAIPNTERVRIREYMRSARIVHKDKSFQGLINKLSPDLQLHLAMHCHGESIRSIGWCRNATDVFIRSCVMMLNQDAMPKGEVVYRRGDFPSKLYIVQSGVIGLQARLISVHECFGEDIVLRYTGRVSAARAITFVTVYSIARINLMELIKAYPEVEREARRSAIKMSFRSCAVEILLAMAELKRSGNIFADSPEGDPHQPWWQLRPTSSKNDIVLGDKVSQVQSVAPEWHAEVQDSSSDSVLQKAASSRKTTQVSMEDARDKRPSEMMRRSELQWEKIEGETQGKPALVGLSPYLSPGGLPPSGPSGAVPLSPLQLPAKEHQLQNNTAFQLEGPSHTRVWQEATDRKLQMIWESITAVRNDTMELRNQVDSVIKISMANQYASV